MEFQPRPVNHGLAYRVSPQVNASHRHEETHTRVYYRRERELKQKKTRARVPSSCSGRAASRARRLQRGTPGTARKYWDVHVNPDCSGPPLCSL